MNERLERALITIARRSAPSLVPSGWQQPGDYALLAARPLSDLAGALAAHNVLVLIGELSPELAHQAAVHFKDWADCYIQFYARLCETLFPSFTQVNAYYADQEWPPVVVIYGAATPLIIALAEYVAPFAATRQDKSPSDVEIRGLIDTILDQLEAGDLPREDYRRLLDEGAAVLKQLLGAQVRQLPLTPPALALAGVDTMTTLPAPPPTLPPETPAPNTMPPETLPEDFPAESAAPFYAGDVPIFFDFKPRSGGRRPPVPDLPEMPRDPASGDTIARDNARS
jgi:hypothetical protein